jgi:hypothetical protein
MVLRIYTFALSPFCFSLSSFQYWSTYHHLLITSITLTISSSITWCVPTYLYISLMTKVSTLRFHQLFKTKLELSPPSRHAATSRWWEPDAVGRVHARGRGRRAWRGPGLQRPSWAEGRSAGAGRKAEPTLAVGQMGGSNPLGEKNVFKFSFSNKFQIIVFNSHFEQENDLFWKWPKNKSCLEFNPLQLCFRDQLKILHRFWIGM